VRGKAISKNLKSKMQNRKSAEFAECAGAGGSGDQVIFGFAILEFGLRKNTHE